MAERGALATLNIDDSIARIADGTMSKVIAAEWGVLPKTLRDKLKRANPTAYAQAVLDQADTWAREATEYAIECADKDDAPIARVRLEGAYKWAAVVNPTKYNPRQNIDLGVQISVVIARHVATAQSQRTIEHDPTVNTQAIDCKDIQQE